MNIGYTLVEEMPFSLIFTCRTCSYMSSIISNVKESQISGIIDDEMLNRPCKNCEGGEMKFRFCNVSSPYLHNFINGLCFRVMNNGMYLREAFEDPCSLNICTCDRLLEDTILVSYNRLYPFVCAHCSKFWLHEELQRRQDLSFGFLRSMQINILLHNCNGEHYDYSDSLTQPKLYSMNKFRLAENKMLRQKL